MTKSAFVIGSILLLLVAVSKTQADDLQLSGRIPSGTAGVHDPVKEDACDCCQKCKAAQSPIHSDAEEGATLKDACEDCCHRCGKVLQPAPQDIPPEIVNKPVPPEIMDKHER